MNLLNIVYQRINAIMVMKEGLTVSCAIYILLVQ